MMWTTRFSILCLFALLSLFACDSGETTDGDLPGDGDSTPDGDQQLDGDLSPVDGDGALTDGDADVVDGDARIDFTCNGPCMLGDPAVCLDDGSHCFCKDGGWAQEDCEQACMSHTGGSSLGCAFDQQAQQFDCRCEIPQVTCRADIEIASLPYSNSGDTSNALNDFSVIESCFDWDLPGQDLVYSLPVKANSAVTIVITPQDRSYDPALVLSQSCSNQATCSKGADRYGAGEAETLTYAAIQDGRILLIVDSGYLPDNNASKGKYTLQISEKLYVDGDADPPDPDGDEDLVDGDWADGDLPDGDVTDGDLSDGDLLDGDADAEGVDGDTEQPAPEDGDASYADGDVDSELDVSESD